MVTHFRAVEPMGLTAIESAASELRKILRIEPHARVKMVHLVETVLEEVLPGYMFYVVPDEDLPGMDGITAVGSFTICLAEHTYVDLCDDTADARVVAAHELGHLILHSHQQPALARRTFNDDRVDPEWQADRFAEFWLAPSAGVAQCGSAEEVARRFTVPIEVAERRFDAVASRRREESQGELFK